VIIVTGIVTTLSRHQVMIVTGSVTTFSRHHEMIEDCLPNGGSGHVGLLFLLFMFD
jgi:hypothetical protein